MNTKFTATATTAAPTMMAPIRRRSGRWADPMIRPSQMARIVTVNGMMQIA